MCEERKETTISTKIFVGNLNFKTTKDELAQLLSQAGRVVDVHLPTDRETGRVRGFAFVEFSNESEAAEAIKLFNGQDMAGRKLNINSAEDRPRRADGPRPYRQPAMGSGFPPSDSREDPFGRPNRPLKNKGSRRGLRARKRSISF